MTELLAPVGNRQNFIAAVNFGADAVYLGLDDFSARKNAENFTLENLRYYISYAHLFDVKVYVAVNTLVKNSELNKFFDMVGEAYSIGADAFIVQDVFLGKELIKRFDGIVLHLSTQAGINNIYGARLAADCGFKRVILSRETALDEIKEIASFIETEVFIHGALCTSFSGHCYMSSFAGGNSGNRGFCKQPCRQLYEYSGEGIQDKKRYALSLSDLCLKDELKIFTDSGVSSFKIEGRMRTPEYTAASVRLYRHIIDGKSEKNDLSELTEIFNRGNYTKGYLFGQDKNLISDKVQNNLGLKIGCVRKISGDELFIDGNFIISVGDGFKIIRNGYETGNAGCMNLNGNPQIKFNGNVKTGDEVYITKDTSLSEKLLSFKKLYPLTVCAQIFAGEKIKFTCGVITVQSGEPVEESINQPLNKTDIESNLLKTDIYPFKITAEIKTDGKSFAPKSALNKLRARLYEEVFYSFSNSVKQYKSTYNIENISNNYDRRNCGLTIISDIFSFKSEELVLKLVFAPSDYNDDAEFIKFSRDAENFGAEKYLFVPAFANSLDIKIIENRLNSGIFDGIYADGLWAVEYAAQNKIKFIAGLGINAFNDVDIKELYSMGASDVCVSKELSAKDIKEFKMRDFTVFSLGKISVMELMYCPFGKNCNVCKRSGYFNLTDFSGRKFTVRRFKISSCRFEIYNCCDLKTDYKFDGNYYNFMGYSEDKKEELLKCGADAASIIGDATSGSLKRGIN